MVTFRLMLEKLGNEFVANADGDRAPAGMIHVIFRSRHRGSAGMETT